MAASLMVLPPELLHQVLSNLPVSSLLAFSATNRTNQIFALDALTSLNLAIFPRPLHCTLAFMRDEQRNGGHSIAEVGRTCKSTNPKDRHDRRLASEAREQQISEQNALACEILKKKDLRRLKSLTLQLYDISSTELTSIIATQLSHLRELELNFQHAHIHDPSLPGAFWREPGRGSPAWNSLAGLGDDNARKLRLKGLRSLKIERGSVTPMQLRKWIEANPHLQRLHLDNVRGVTKSFVDWLGSYCAREECKLEEISLENCSELVMLREDDFKWMGELSDSPSLKFVSLYRCKNVRHDVMARIIDNDEFEEWGLNTIETVIPPKGPPYHYGVAETVDETRKVLSATKTATGAACKSDEIEVDPAYVVHSVAAAA